MAKNSRRPETIRSEQEAELLRHAADVVAEVAVDGRIAFVSGAVEPILARPPSDFVGRNFMEVVVPEDRAETLAQFQKVVATGAEPTHRCRVLRSDGLRVEFESTLRSFEAEGERRIVCVARDVTQQSAASAVSRARDDHYRRIVEAGGRPAAIFDRNGALLFSNAGFKSTFGRDVGVTEMFRRMSDEVRRAMETRWYESNRLDRPGAGSGDFDYFRDDGERVWYSATWDAFQNEEGQRDFAVLYEDISRRKQIEFALLAIAQGIDPNDPQQAEATLEAVARALQLDRIALGALDPRHPGNARIIAGWQDAEPLVPAMLELGGLPDATAARGDACLFPSGLAALVPEVAERFSPEFESYVGQPLVRPDGTVVGFVGGYSRRPLTDTDLARSLTASLAGLALPLVTPDRAAATPTDAPARFEVLSSRHPEILSELDEQGRILFVSEAVSTVLGFEPDNLVGGSLSDVVHPADHQKVQDAQDSLLGGDEEQALIINRVLDAQGGHRWLESRASTFRNADGAPRALIVSRDITARRRADLARSLLQRVVEDSGDIIVVCDPDTTVLFANDEACRRLGAPLEAADARALLGRRLGDLLPAEAATRLASEVLPHLSPTRPWSGELPLPQLDGAPPVPAEAIAFYFNAEGQTDRPLLAITFRDVGARRVVEEALRESELRLEQAQRMEAVGRLAGGIAHDFNNLLTAIIGYSDLVLAAVGDDHAARRDAEEILRAAERAGGLTRQLLAFSRRQVLQPEPVDLNTIVAEIDRMMRRLIGENIELVTIQDGELAPIIADPGQMEQVIVNLVVNARDAMPRGGRLVIETANHRQEAERPTESGLLPAGDYAVLRVTDSGQGIDPETRPHIFEPFFTTKETHQGTGLGLASVYGIVSQSGGQIDLETQPAEGSTFSIYLPVAQSVALESSDRAETVMDGGSETILLVEDAAPVRHLVRRTLEKKGYEVLVAESATAALRQCARHEGPIDLILADVVLPRTSGPEIAQRAAQLRPGLRALFMSGFTDETLVRHGLDTTRDELIEKPFTSQSLLTRVRRALDAD